MVRIKLASALAADHEIAVVSLLEPGSDGDTGVHDDQRPLRGGKATDGSLGYSRTASLDVADRRLPAIAADWIAAHYRFVLGE